MPDDGGREPPEAPAQAPGAAGGTTRREPPDAPAQAPGDSRRKLLEGLAKATGAAAVAAAVWPAAAALVEPLGREPAHDAPWVDVAGEREVRADAALRAPLRIPVRDGFFTTLVDAGSVWLRGSPAGLVALSASCPHLGCGVSQGPRGFVCPCHDSQFGPDGAYLKGPSPRSMDPLPVKVEAGRILVQAIRYAAGTKTRRAL